jgi:putative Mn2+ efflux pump MntP
VTSEAVAAVAVGTVAVGTAENVAAVAVGAVAVGTAEAVAAVAVGVVAMSVITVGSTCTKNFGREILNRLNFFPHEGV